MTYYYVDTRESIAAILRDGFSISHEDKEKTTGAAGVYLTDAPGAPDPDYPLDQLLEITLPPEIDISQFKIKAGAPEEPIPARWREWLVPSHLLNEWALIRLLPKEEWGPRWERWLLEQQLEGFDQAFKDLVERGYLASCTRRGCLNPSIGVANQSTS
jgi:hypothetical protein